MLSENEDKKVLITTNVPWAQQSECVFINLLYDRLTHTHCTSLITIKFTFGRCSHGLVVVIVRLDKFTNITIARRLCTTEYRHAHSNEEFYVWRSSWREWRENATIDETIAANAYVHSSFCALIKFISILQLSMSIEPNRMHEWILFYSFPMIITITGSWWTMQRERKTARIRFD